VRVFLLSAGLFLLVLGTLVLGGFVYVMEPGPEGRLRYIQTAGKLLLHRYSLIESLSPAETKRLYLSSCTRKCHSKDVIELTPRTAREWEWIVARMGVADRTDLTETEAKTIAEYLQLNYLSNVPTVLSDETMRFLKRHLWRMDFGESDIYLDIIYIPRVHRSLMPYLAFNSAPRDSEDALFIVYVNTHSGVVPQWDLAQITTLVDDQGDERRATGWEVLYEDGQHHHRQGILTFPGTGPGTKQDGDETSGTLELTIHPPGMRKRVFQWNLPIPAVGVPPTMTKTGGPSSVAGTD
jgi:hypothetical protein